jgi:hypothetical protein
MAIWAVFAALLPLVVRGRALVLDIIGAAVWAAGLAAAHVALADVIAPDVPLDEPRGLIAGTILAAIVAVAAAGAGLISPPDPEEDLAPRIATP